jgi:hypothetical protein
MEPNAQPDWDLLEEVTDLINEGFLEQGTPAYATALLAVEVGYEGLSQDQKAVFDSVVVPTMEKRAAQLEAEMRAG